MLYIIPVFLITLLLLSVLALFPVFPADFRFNSISSRFYFAPFSFTCFWRACDKISVCLFFHVLFDDCSFCSRPPFSIFHIHSPRNHWFLSCASRLLSITSRAGPCRLFAQTSFLFYPCSILCTGALYAIHSRSLRSPCTFRCQLSFLAPASAKASLLGQLPLARAKGVTPLFFCRLFLINGGWLVSSPLTFSTF